MACRVIAQCFMQLALVTLSPFAKSFRISRCRSVNRRSLSQSTAELKEKAKIRGEEIPPELFVSRFLYRGHCPVWMHICFDFSEKSLRTIYIYYERGLVPSSPLHLM